VAESTPSHAGLTQASRRRQLAARHALRIIARHRPSGSLLDFGAGGGHLLIEARKRGYDVSAVEVETELVAHLQYLGIPCTTSITGTHDIIYTRDVLSHLRDPVAVLGSLHDHLAAGGLLVMETGNYADVDLADYPLSHLDEPALPSSGAYGQNRHPAPKVRAFVDWVAELFGGCPLLGGVDNGGECSYTARPGDHTLRSEVALQNVAEQAAIQE